MQVIIKKCQNPYFKALRERRKNFDIRLADRIYCVGDAIIFKEYDAKNDSYSGKNVQRIIKYILDLKIDGSVKFNVTETEFWSVEEIKKHGLVILGF